MTPFFNPGPNPHGDAKIFLAGVGELMTEVAGEVCDGFLCHGFTTERYLREVTLPALERGAAKAGRTLADIEISGPAFVVTGTNEEEMARSAAGTQAADRVLRVDAGVPRRARAARLGRPAGRAQQHVEGGQVGGDGRAHHRRDPPHLRRRRRAREAGRGPRGRYGDIVQRISFYAPYASDPERWRAVMDSSPLRAGTRRPSGRSEEGRIRADTDH